MRVEGIDQSMAAQLQEMGGPGQEAAIEKKIQSLKRELSELEKKDELSQDEIKKKQNLQQQISELEQELQKIKAEKQNQKADREKNEDKNEPDRIKEEGKGENIDEYV